MVKNGSNIEAWRGESFIADSFSAVGAPYDGADRLTAAYRNRYLQPGLRSGFNPGDSVVVGGPTLPLANYSYDLNSQFTSLQHVGPTGDGEWDTVDDLTYTYSKGRLVKIDDACEVLSAGSSDFNDGADEETEFDYDEDGRLTRDANRGVRKMAWNVSGNLSTVDFDNGEQLAYAYDAAGVKHRVRLQRPAQSPGLYPLDSIGFGPGPGHWGGNATGGNYGTVELPDSISHLSPGLFPGTGGGTINPGFPQVTLPKDTVITERVYIGSLEFEDSTLCRVKTPSGYWDAQGRYHLMVHDFQGNVSAVVRLDGQTPTAVQTNAYYPYGTPMATSTGAIENRYRYGGKEWESTNGLNLYDFEARFHDPTFGFLSPDPLYGQADGAPHGIAPRVYCAANPLRFIDPSGMRLFIRDDNNEAYEWMKIDDTWGFYNKAGELYNGTDNGVIQYTNALSQLMETETGRELVEDVVNLSEGIKLIYDEGNTNSISSEIRWSENQNNYKSVRVNGGWSFNAISNLGHELAHVLFKRIYPEGAGVWFNAYDINGNPKPIGNSDIFATHYENKIRAEMDLPLRIQYLGTTNNEYVKNVGKIIDDSGRSYYYDNKGNTNFMRINNKNNRYQYRKP